MSHKHISEEGYPSADRTWKNEGYVKYGYNYYNYSEKIHTKFVNKKEGKIEVSITDHRYNGMVCEFDELKGLTKCTMQKIHII